MRSREIRWLDGRALALRILADVTALRKAAGELDNLERSARIVAWGKAGSDLADELEHTVATLAASGRSRSQADRALQLVGYLRDLLRGSEKL